MSLSRRKTLLSRIRSLLLASLVVRSLARAQTTTVGGQVVDRTKNAPLPQVLVTLLNADSASVDSVLTGPDGTFMLTSTAGGTFRVRLRAPKASEYLSDTLTVATGAYVMRSFPIDAAPQPYFEFQVDKPASPAKGTVAPRYPEDLRADGVSGCVLTQFVVDASGQPEIESFKVLAMSHLGFAQAVLKALPEMRFTPAKIGAQTVRQLVQQPFTFTIEEARTVVYGHAVEEITSQSGRLPRAQSMSPMPPRPPAPKCN